MSKYYLMKNQTNSIIVVIVYHNCQSVVGVTGGINFGPKGSSVYIQIWFVGLDLLMAFLLAMS
jgi:hypothetical protein